MPSNHRGQKINGSSANCVNCDSAGTHIVDSGVRLCEDCNSDYLSFKPYMHGNLRPFWLDDATD